MSVIILGPDQRERIAKMIAYATAHPVKLEVAMAAKIDSPNYDVRLADRKPGAERPASEHAMLGDVRVAYSHEEQPAGMFRHLSASVRQPGKLPAPVAVSMICTAFGFSDQLCDALMARCAPPLNCLVWLEEFDPGHQAVNIIELIEAHNVH